MGANKNSEFQTFLGESLLNIMKTRAGALNPIILDLRDQWIRAEYRAMIEEEIPAEKAKKLLSKKIFYDENNKPYSIGYEAINKIIYRKEHETDGSQSS